MKLSEITSDQKLDEILPAIGAVAGGVARAAAPAIARGAMALGKAAIGGAAKIGSAVA